MMEEKETKIGRNSPTLNGSVIVRNISPTFTVGSISGSGEMRNEWLDRPDHPLLNNVVLGIIFGHLGATELMKCRLVSKTWNVYTIPLTRKIFTVTIYGEPNPEKKLHTIDNFVGVFRSNDLGIPFARFILGSFCTTGGNGQEFLKICGNTIKDINFLGDTFRVEDLSELLKSTPKLETLKIPKRIHSTSGNIVKLFPEDSKQRLASLKDFTVLDDNPKERNQFCPTFLEELMTAAQNISCVNLWDSFPARGEENLTTSSFEVLSLIEKLGREPSIQDLLISHMKRVDSNYIELLHRMAKKVNGLKLKKLRYNTVYCDHDSHKILKIISLFKDTLEFLEIIGKRFTSFAEFPEMKRLTRLFLTFHMDFNSRHVNLNKIFPSLQGLHLYIVPEPKYDEFFPESEPCPTVKSLQLLWFTLKINGFNQMLTVFPNLTDFRVNITEDGEEILRQVWTHMTQLESLSISGTFPTTNSLDSMLTGILDRELIVRDVFGNLDKLTTAVERRERILDLRNQYSQLPSVGNLTRLRSLTLDLIGFEKGIYHQRKHLTDFTGYLGFYSIKSLKTLIVRRCKLTRTCCEILTNDMELEACITSGDAFIMPVWN